LVPAISVNTSFLRLRNQDLLESLRHLHIPRDVLSFELLESIFLDEPDNLVGWNIDGIRELGIGVNIDDFGTGHASIISLLKIRPNSFKLDRQFVREITTSASQRALVGSLIGIGKSLHIKVVAEGVETMAQARVLRELGCDILQGYAFARPMSADALEDFVAGNAWRERSRPLSRAAN
jgi:EAL domain-containing protein (putative c-di-GMP-specific phosphodiesterase class I)